MKLTNVLKMRRGIDNLRLSSYNRIRSREVTMNWVEMQELGFLLEDYQYDETMEQLIARLEDIEEFYQDSMRLHLEGEKKIKC